MRLEHVGIAVKDARAVAALLEKLFDARPYKSEIVESEAVRTVFFDAGGSKLELLEATAADSPITRHVERRGEGLHHLAFEVDDIEATFERLTAAGFRALNDSPKQGADGKLIFFIHPKDTAGVLIELCQSAPPPLQPRFVESGARRVAYFESGRMDAPPLLLLHAAMGSVELELRELMSGLEPDFRTIAVDFSGHGRSDHLGRSEPTLELFRDDVIAVLDHLDIERAHAFGFSMGGAVALRLAVDRPERIERLAFHATNVHFDEDEARVMATTMNPELIEAGNTKWSDTLAAAHGKDRWMDLARRMAHFIQTMPTNPILDDDLMSIEQPVLVSHGDADRFFRLARALHLHKTLPNANLAVHPGSDHLIPARELAPMLRGFFFTTEDAEGHRGAR